MKEHIPFLERHKAEMIEGWIKRLELSYPHFYDTEKLRQECNDYIALIFDVQIPVEVHPVFLKYRKWCKALLAKKAPFDHVLQSSAFFREAFLEAISGFQAERETLLKIISTVIPRIDLFQSAIYKFFLFNAREMIAQRDKKIEALHEDKLNLIGKMASSMAHEIRNPLTSIRGFLTLICRALSPKDMVSINNYATIIEHEIQSIERQITGLLSFSRKPIADEERADAALNELIDKSLLLANPRFINENVTLTLELQEGLTVTVQKVAMLQLVSNLLNNALDALLDFKGERKVTIRTFSDESFVYMQIINSGPEIPRAMQQSLFDPFVTGKRHGTGLGLATCKQIAENNDATISFMTNAEETTFAVKFSRKSVYRQSG